MAWHISLFEALRDMRRSLRPSKKTRPSSRRNAPAREPGELAVQSFGVALAVASTGFAAYMISDTERRPQFAGLEHLSIFSKPSHSTARLEPTQVAGGQQKQIDYTPVGSISEPARGASAPGFVLLGVRGGSAVIQTPTTILRVSQGDLVEGLGRIASIEKRGEKWVIVTSTGLVFGN